MIQVLIPQNPDFRIYAEKLKSMYRNSQGKICDDNSFEFIISNTLFYLFLKDDSIIGVLYFFKDNENLFMNAFGERGNFNEKIECIRMSLGWFNCDIYAEAQNRASALCLLRAGFKRVEGKLFCFFRDN